MLRAAPRVLVVDDDAPICELLKLVLVDEGWEVQTRTSAQEALELLRQWTADVILLDLKMPGLDAEAFLIGCRQQGAGETPILLLSGATKNLDEQAARLGASGAVAKPFDIDELCETLRPFVADDRVMSAPGVASDVR